MKKKAENCQNCNKNLFQPLWTSIDHQNCEAMLISKSWKISLRKQMTS